MENNWKICGITEIGVKHRQSGRGCEDQLTLLKHSDMLVAVLADGAGSRSYAAEGAKTVADQLSAWLEQEFDRLYSLSEQAIQEEIIAFLLEQLSHQAESLQTELRELASTLIFAAVKGNRYLFGNLGDGVIGYRKETDRWIICGPDHDRIPGMTFFVTSRQAARRLHIRTGTGAVSQIAMMTDGMAEIWYDEKESRMTEPLETAMEELGQSESEEAAEAWLKQQVRTEIQRQVWDDIGFILIRRKKEHG